MTRSPLAYPLNRSADTDVGGAADLQTDIMRFMAILALCLVAIFALVQSIPLTPVAPATPETAPAPAHVTAEPVAAEPVAAEPVAAEPVAPPTEEMPAEPVVQEAQIVRRPVASERPPQSVSNDVTLTRPKWVPRYRPAEPVPAETAQIAETPAAEQPASTSPATSQPPPAPEAPADGFTLRFESDAALMRAVASSHVGLYAIDGNGAQRMTVSNSRISFWSASTPNTFHEMEAATVPSAVVDALARTGSDADAVDWGVTLPGKLKTRLDALMQAHRGGSLIIGPAGDIRWEAT